MAAEMKKFFITVVFLILIGCVNPYHNVENIGNIHLLNVTVISGDHSFNHGDISPGGSSGCFCFKLGPKAIVNWSTDKNESHSKKIPIRHFFNFGDIYIKLDGENVIVDYIILE